MAETDEKIKVMSSVREEDKSSVYEKLMQHLGISNIVQRHSVNGISLFFFYLKAKL